MIVFGTVPPPLGGVSVFISRYVDVLRECGREVEVADWPSQTRSQRLLTAFRCLTNQRPIKIEVHGYQSVPIVLALSRPFRLHSELWLHSGQFAGDLNWWQKKILQAALNRFSSVVAVSSHIRALVESHGFTFGSEPRIQHAFLPPDLSTRSALSDTFPNDLIQFSTRASPLLVMQGADAFYQGVDRYGTDIAIEALALIKSELPGARLIVGRPSAGSSQFVEYTMALDERINELRLNDSVYFMTGERQLWPMIAQADIFLRPSNQDGDSISVREALFLGIPVVASDACPRPTTCRVFESRSAVDCARVVVDVLRTVSGNSGSTTQSERVQVQHV